MMRIRTKQRMALIILLILGGSLSGAQFGVPRYPCQPAGIAPTIDGGLNEECWKSLPDVGKFVETNGRQAELETIARLCYDSNNLYVAVEVFEPDMSAVQSRVKNHDGNLAEDDNIQFVVTAKRDLAPFFVFTLNIDGVSEERRDWDPAAQWNGSWQGIVKKTSGKWIIEMAIPFTTMETVTPKPGDIWRMNLIRDITRSNKTSQWTKSLPSWDVSQAGELIFLGQKIISSVSHDVEIDPNNIQVLLSAKGSPGSYNAQFVWSDAKLDIIDKELVIGETKNTTIRQRYPIFDDIQKSQVELSNSNGVLFRSMTQEISAKGAVAVMLKNLKQRISELEETDTPEIYKKDKETLRQRYAEVEKTRNQQAIGDLLYQCNVMAWHSKLSQFKDSSLIWFSLPPFTVTDYDYIPDANQVGSAVRISAMRDEYEPGCVNIQVLDQSKAVLLEVEDLKSASGDVLGADSIDIKVLKYWYQAGKSNFVDGDTWTPELLLKNDAMIQPDHAVKSNKIVDTDDSEKLQPVHIERFHNRQFWLTVHVPVNQSAGLYKGDIAVVSSGKLIGRIPLEICVLPLTMEKTRFDCVMFVNELLSPDGKNAALYEADLREGAAHGCTSWLVQEGCGDKIDANGFATEFDYTMTQKALALRKKYGLIGRTPDLGGHWYTESINKIWRVTEQELVSQPQHKSNVMLYCKGLQRCYDEAGIEYYFYTWDEPAYDVTGKNLRMTKNINDWAHQAGVKIAQAITIEGAELTGNTDIPILDLPSGIIGDARRKLQFEQAWYYWHPTEDPRPDRYLAGAMIWYGGYTGSIPWIYRSYQGWDDYEAWKSSGKYIRICSYTYPGKTKPVLTWQYESLREGYDDLKYLEMLHRRVKKAESMDPSTLLAEDKKLIAQAREMLDVPPVKFRGGARQVPKVLAPQDFVQFRQAVAQLLVKMDGVVNKKQGK